MAGIQFEPNAAGLLFAAGAVVAGGPVFSAGLRALRLSRAFTRLGTAPLARAGDGLGHVHGRVALESPLFSPLSGTPCALYRLEVSAQRGAVRCAHTEARPFRIADGGALARIDPAGARLAIGAGVTRVVAPQEPLSENLRALLERMPEARWLRGTGATLTLTERVLAAEAVCHVVGRLRRRAAAETAVVELARTGTDDQPVAMAATASHPLLDAPDLTVDAGDQLDFLLLGDAPPSAAQLAVARWQALGLVAGPALGLGGLLYFAAVADRLRAAGRF